ncbi:MAG: iron ABC transporter permease [Planctomycetes bacterium]|nr:iron ABC transporter permease [Planctomycetota bacterium]
MTVARRTGHPAAWLLVGVAIIAAAVFASLCVGVIHITPGEVWRVLSGGADDELPRTLVLDIRLPRAVAAVCVGAGLATAGCALQALLRDPLASPTMIGTAQASGFGRVLGVFLGWSYVASVGLAFVAAVAATLLVLAIARSRRGFPSHIVLLAGVNVGMMFAALVGLVQYASKDEGQLSRMVLFLLGGLWQITWQPLTYTAPLTLAAIVLAWLLSRKLDLFARGESQAQRLGLATDRLGVAVLVTASLLTSLAVSIAGVVAFAGLIVPHAARRLTGPLHARLLPTAALLGALLLLGVDCIARTAVAPNELPLGVLTSLIGVPCFLMLLRSIARGSTR